MIHASLKWGDKTAQLEDGKWVSDNAQFADVLNKMIPRILQEKKEFDPYPPATIANETAKRIGGQVVVYSVKDNSNALTVKSIRLKHKPGGKDHDQRNHAPVGAKLSSLNDHLKGRKIGDKVILQVSKVENIGRDKERHVLFDDGSGAWMPTPVLIRTAYGQDPGKGKVSLKQAHKDGFSTLAQYWHLKMNMPDVFEKRQADAKSGVLYWDEKAGKMVMPKRKKKEFILNKVILKFKHGTGDQSAHGNRNKMGMSLPNSFSPHDVERMENEINDDEDWTNDSYDPEGRYQLASEALDKFKTGGEGLIHRTKGKLDGVMSFQSEGKKMLVSEFATSHSGVGGGMFRDLVSLAKTRKLGIYLESSDAAVNFYLRMGMKREKEGGLLFSMSINDVQSYKESSVVLKDDVDFDDLLEPKSGVFTKLRTEKKKHFTGTDHDHNQSVHAGRRARASGKASYDDSKEPVELRSLRKILIKELDLDDNIHVIEDKSVEYLKLVKEGKDGSDLLNEIRGLEDDLKVKMERNTSLLKSPTPVINPIVFTKDGRSYYDLKEPVKKEIDDVCSIIDKSLTPSINRMKVVYQAGVRSYYSSDEEAIYIGDHDKVGIAHEMGHRIENTNDGVQKACQEFLKKRTQGEKPVPLAEQEQDAKFWGREEVACKDKFLSPYIGKIYKSGHTEILSMGLHLLFQNPAKFAKDDPEMFYFIMGILRGKIK